MSAEAVSSKSNGRRNRIIAIVAGVVTVAAIVFGFAGDFLGLPWKWLRPAAELLLLAELVGLIVLERHQLFEPVSDNVSEMKAQVAEMREAIASANLPAMGATLAQLNDNVSAAGQVRAYNGAREVLRARLRLMREASARRQEGPLVIRFAVLSGRSLSQDSRELGDESEQWAKLVTEHMLVPGSTADSNGHNCSFRLIAVYAGIDALNGALEALRPLVFDRNPLNFELKILARARPEALVSPTLITDRAVLLTYDDETSSFRWGVVLEGRQYVSLFGRWFDDRWASIPDSYMVFARTGLNQKAVDLVRKDMERAEATAV
jgi:hypothetical protein